MYNTHPSFKQGKNQWQSDTTSQHSVNILLRPPSKAPPKVNIYLYPPPSSPLWALYQDKLTVSSMESHPSNSMHRPVSNLLVISCILVLCAQLKMISCFILWQKIAEGESNFWSAELTEPWLTYLAPQLSLLLAEQLTQWQHDRPCLSDVPSMYLCNKQIKAHQQKHT